MPTIQLGIVREIQYTSNSIGARHSYPASHDNSIAPSSTAKRMSIPKLFEISAQVKAKLTYLHVIVEELGKGFKAQSRPSGLTM